MNITPSTDPRIAAYLDEGPTDLPLEDREGIATAVAGLSQRRRWLDRLGSGGQRLVGALAGSAVTLAVVVVVTSSGLLPIRPGAAVSSPQPSAAVSSSGLVLPKPMPASVELEPGRYAMYVHVRIELTVGEGWYMEDNGLTITRRPGVPEALSIGEVYPSEIATDVCANGPKKPIFTAGDDLKVWEIAAAIEALTGIDRVGPMPAQVGNRPAQKYVLTLAPECVGGGDGRWVMGGENGVGILVGGTATIYVIDIDPESVVIVVTQRATSEAEQAMIDAVLASMNIWNDSL